MKSVGHTHRVVCVVGLSEGRGDGINVGVVDSRGVGAHVGIVDGMSVGGGNGARVGDNVALVTSLVAVNVSTRQPHDAGQMTP